MIQAVIEHINTNINTLKFGQVSGLCEMTQEVNADGQEKQYPVIYKGKDSLRFITVFDFRSGAFWHMKEGDTDIENLESPRAEYEYLRYTTHMSAYAIIRRSMIDDTEYSHEKMANNIVHQINEKNVNSLKSTIGVNKVNVIVTGYSTDAGQIDEIFQNVEIQWRHDLTLVVVNYDIILEGYQQCFTNYSC